MTGDMFLICVPRSYSVTYPVVCAQSYRKPTGDLTTKESGNRFHTLHMFSIILEGTRHRLDHKKLLIWQVKTLHGLKKTNNDSPTT